MKELPLVPIARLGAFVNPEHKPPAPPKRKSRAVVVSNPYYGIDELFEVGAHDEPYVNLASMQFDDILLGCIRSFNANRKVDMHDYVNIARLKAFYRDCPTLSTVILQECGLPDATARKYMQVIKMVNNLTNNMTSSVAQ